MHGLMLLVGGYQSVQLAPPPRHERLASLEFCLVAARALMLLAHASNDDSAQAIAARRCLLGEQLRQPVFERVER